MGATDPISANYVNVKFTAPKMGAEYKFRVGTEIMISGLGTCNVKKDGIYLKKEGIFARDQKLKNVNVTNEQLMSLGCFDLNKDNKIDQKDMSAARKIDASKKGDPELRPIREDQMSERINAKFQKHGSKSEIYPKQPIHAGVLLSKDNEGFQVNIKDKKGDSNKDQFISVDVNPQTPFNVDEYLTF